MQIKVCGLKYRENIEQVVALSPDCIGFIFYRGSRRNVRREQHLPAFVRSIGSVCKVGVFVNEPIPAVMEAVRLYDLDMVQLHGQETPEYCAVLQHTVPVMKAFAVGVRFDMKKLHAYETNCSYFLFDTLTGTYGGSGKVFDWQLLAGREIQRPFFLSGGIGPGNINDVFLFQHNNCVGVDVNSCVEQEPAYKDIQKVKTIIHEIRTR